MQPRGSVGNRGSNVPVGGLGYSDTEVIKRKAVGNNIDKNSDGLNPNRQRGFNAQSRIETPTLNDMKAKQGAIVSRFMTFANRKNTVMVELYERSFYTKRPGWDSLANFVYNDLCPSDLL